MTARNRPFPLAGRLTAALAASLILVGSFTAPAAAVEAPTKAEESVNAAKKPQQGPFTAGRYIVTLTDDAVATYDGGVGSFGATRAAKGKKFNPRSDAAKGYAKHLAATQSDVAAAVGAEISSSFTLALNGFSASLDAGQAAALAADPRVASVVPNELLHTQAATTSTDFLKLSGDTGVWKATGGVDQAGKGVVVGIIDTGIAPENPSFAGKPLGSAEGDEPWRSGDTITYTKADGGTFTGACVAGQQFTADDCSTKIVGARYFIDDESIPALYGPEDGEYLSPRDGAGHGSHTASTAAGNHGVEASIHGADLGVISGVAPAAKIAAYKVCWHFVSGDGCFTGDIIDAIDQAVADGVDVLNYSIGGGAAQTTVSPTDQAFFGAAAAGIFVAASAGNDGPGESTADNADPWITTVAASTIPARETTVALGNGQAVLGGSITLPKSGTLSGPLVSAAKNTVAGTPPTALCEPGSLDPAKVTGTIVLCERGGVDRVVKSAEVLRAGGIGMVLVNPEPNSVDLDVHSVPTVHVDSDGYAALVGYADTAGATASFLDGNPTGLPSNPAPQMAGFSSRGPILADGGDLLKPDLTAPGVAILADGANSDTGAPSFAFMSGTSMSSPHIAGLAALYLGKRPNATPAEIKSSMMTTAYAALDSTGAAISDPFAQGAGHVDPAKMFEPGLVYLNGVDDWKGYVQATGAFNFGVTPVDPSSLNLASVSVGALAGTESVTRTVTSTAAGDFTAQPVTMAGVDVTVTPSTLHFDAKGETKTFTITFARTTAPLNAFTTGYLRWADGTRIVTSPLAVRPVPLAAPAAVEGSGTSGTVDIPVQPGVSGTMTASATGLARGTSVKGEATKDGERTEYIVEVPQGTTFARFALDAADDAIDLDLSVFWLDDFNVPAPSGFSDSALADEHVDVEAPTPGYYLVRVEDARGQGSYALTTYTLGAAGDEGQFAVTPATQDVALNVTSTLSASWRDLAPGSSYLGRLRISATDAASGAEDTVSTVVSVTSPGTAPAPPAADPKLDPTFQYVHAGDRIGFVGSGLAANAAYRLVIDSAEVPLAVGATSDAGGLGRQVGIPASTPLGAHTVTARFEDGTTVSTEIIITTLGIRQVFDSTSADFDGTPLVSLIAAYGGTGTMRFVIETSEGQPVYSEDVQVAATPERGDSILVSTKTIRVPAGNYVGKVWQVLDSGETVQEKQVAFTVANGPASSLVTSQNPTDPNKVDFTLVNASDSEYRLQLRYKLCSGPIVASTYRTFLGENVDTLSLAGIAHVDFMLAGQVLGGFENTSPDRCTGTPTFAEPMWVTFEPTDKKAAKGTAPITATMNFRYPAHIYGMDLTAGYGEELKANGFFSESFPVDMVEEPGPIVKRTFHIDEGKDFWVNSDFEIETPTKVIRARSEVQAEPLTVKMLAPVKDNNGHGKPTPRPGKP